MASYFATQVRIADEIQRNLNLAAWLREALENELDASPLTKNGPPRAGIDAKTVTKWRDVVKVIEALTACKIRLDASAKKMAEAMSPEEELEAVRSYVRSLEPSVAREFLKGELAWRDSH